MVDQASIQKESIPVNEFHHSDELVAMDEPTPKHCEHDRAEHEIEAPETDAEGARRNGDSTAPVDKFEESPYAKLLSPAHKVSDVVSEQKGETIVALVSPEVEQWAMKAEAEVIQLELQVCALKNENAKLTEQLHKLQKLKPLQKEAETAEVSLMQSIAVENELKNMDLLRMKVGLEDLEHARRLQLHSHVELLTQDANSAVNTIKCSVSSLNDNLPYSMQVSSRWHQGALDKILSDEIMQDGIHVPVDANIRNTVKHLHNLESFVTQLSQRVATHVTEIVQENRLIRELLEHAKRGEETADLLANPLVQQLWAEHESVLNHIKGAHELEINKLHEACAQQIFNITEMRQNESISGNEQLDLANHQVEKYKHRLSEVEKETFEDLNLLRSEIAVLKADDLAGRHTRVPRVQLEAAITEIEKYKKRSEDLTAECASLRVEKHHIETGQAQRMANLDLLTKARYGEQGFLSDQAGAMSMRMAPVPLGEPISPSFGVHQVPVSTSPYKENMLPLRIDMFSPRPDIGASVSPNKIGNPFKRGSPHELSQFSPEKMQIGARAKEGAARLARMFETRSTGLYRHGEDVKSSNTANAHPTARLRQPRPRGMSPAEYLGL